MQLPQREAMGGIFCAGNEALVSTAAMESAQPYSGLMNSAFFPTQPKPASTASVLLGSGERI
ncbi:MAG: hypothetical protein FWF69_04815 [Firmicutes bacterium]|nr:hypothetical protein [Bacillota bacterium]